MERDNLAAAVASPFVGIPLREWCLGQAECLGIALAGSARVPVRFSAAALESRRTRAGQDDGGEHAV